MLSSIGIDAELVLVRTGLRGGFDPTVASLAPFDHAIAYVPALDLYLDGTAEATGSGELPALDRGALALRISGGKGLLVTLPEVTGLPTTETQEFAVELEGDGSFRYVGSLSNQGFEAAAWRNRYHAEATRRDRVRGDLALALGPVDLEPNGLDVGDLDALEAPVTVRVRGRGHAQHDGVAWSIPVGRRTQLVATHAALATRVLGLPAAVLIDGPFARYELIVETTARQIVIHRTLEWRKSRIPPADYPAWRAFCQGVDAAGAPRVLIAR